MESNCGQYRLDTGGSCRPVAGSSGVVIADCCGTGLGGSTLREAADARIDIGCVVEVAVSELALLVAAADPVIDLVEAPKRRP